MSDVTVILNVYNRGYTLEKQIAAIKAQTYNIKDENIWIWYNKGKNEQPLPANSKHRTFICNENTKFHGRFAAALLVQTQYVAMFDDDIIPGTRWIENCIDSIEEKNGLYGASGVILNSLGYENNTKIGWNGVKNGKIQEVDLVGHCWFGKKEIFKYLWYEEPYTFESGEDISFSYMIQKYANLKTYVPPHLINDIEFWGNISGDNFGNDNNATWLTYENHFPIRNEITKHYINKGWSLVNEKYFKKN
jgi:hypothetical protein